MSEVAFRWETVEDILAAPNLTEMLQGHYDELCVGKDDCPLAPDFDRYKKLDNAGFLKVFAGRRDRQLVAYSVWMVGPHLHYSTTYHAVEDLFYLEPELRRGGLGFRLFDEAEAGIVAHASQRGWPLVRFIAHSKYHFGDAEEHERDEAMRVALRLVRSSDDDVALLAREFLSMMRAGLRAFFLKRGYTASDTLWIKTVRTNYAQAPT